MAITGPLTGPLTSGIVGSITGIIQRYFTDLASPGSQHYTIPTWTATGDFSVSFEFSTSSTSFMYVLGRAVGFTNYIAVRGSGNRIEVRIGGGTVLLFTAAPFSDGKLHSAMVNRVSGVPVLVLDGVTYPEDSLNTDLNTLTLDTVGQDASSGFYDGVIANVSLTESGGDNRFYPINENWVGSTVLVDSIGGQNGSAVNITSADAQLFDQVADGWTGTQLLTSLSVPLEVTDNGDGTYTAATTAIRQLEEQTNGSELGLVYRFKYDVISITSGAFSAIAGGTSGISVSTPTNDVQDDVISGATSPTGLRFAAASGTNGTFRPKSIKQLLERA